MKHAAGEQSAPMPRWAGLVGDFSRPPEQSVAVRALTLLTLVAAIVGAGVTGAASTTLCAGATILASLGFLVAHWRRNDSRPWIAVVTTLAVMGLVTYFVLTRGGVTSLPELRTPMAELLIMMEAIRSFGMRTRRDLRFALASSAAIVAVAGSLSLSMVFALPLALWAVLAATALALTHRHDLRDRFDAPESPTAAASARALSPSLAAIVIATVIAAGAFLVAPAAQSSRFLSTLSRLPNPSPVPTTGGLSNPSLGSDNPSNSGGSDDTTGGRTSFGYFGFANELDTSVRGRPDDSLVMRVRSSVPDFWRGQSFDVWDGRRWTLSEGQTRVLGGRESIIVTPVPDDPVVRSSELIQTFFLETSGPNLIFAAPRPAQVYIPQSALFQLRDGTLRTGVELDEGTIYSVVSRRPQATQATLRAAGDTAVNSPETVRSRYATQPGIPNRVQSLADELLAGVPTTYDKVMVLEKWMAENTTYSLDTPPLPPDADAVEQFLLVDQIGFCEQIATSLVVMLRSQGIPARLGVGYTPGERNPFTGLYEVKASNAHAWAEVYFPTVGWQIFDPTASVPLAGNPPPDAARVGLASYLRTTLGPHVRTLALIGALLLVAILGAALWAPTRRVLARRRARRERPWSQEMLQMIEDAGQSLGRPRDPGETSREYVEALGRSVLPDPRLERVIDALDKDAFDVEHLDDGERERVEELVRAIGDPDSAPSAAIRDGSPN